MRNHVVWLVEVTGDNGYTPVDIKVFMSRLTARAWGDEQCPPEERHLSYRIWAQNIYTGEVVS